MGRRGCAAAVSGDVVVGGTDGGDVVPIERALGTEDTEFDSDAVGGCFGLHKCGVEHHVDDADDCNGE